jgi:hypothetical protein
MKIKELVEKLEKLDQELDIVVPWEDGITYFEFIDYDIEQKEIIKYDFDKKSKDGVVYKEIGHGYNKKEWGEGEIVKVLILG